MKLNALEHDVLEDALRSYLVQLRTIITPDNLAGQTSTEKEFLASDNSARLRERYMATKDLLTLVRARPTTHITAN